MVIQVLYNKSYYKGQNILDSSFRNAMNNYFNPYEYNFESIIKDKKNTDVTNQKSQSHLERKNKKK